MVPIVEFVAGGLIDEDTFGRYHRIAFQWNVNRKENESQLVQGH